MLIYFRRLAAASAIIFLALPSTAPANAAPLITFVSGKGTNSGDCSSPANPCRTLQFAHNQTAPKGEIKVLDPAFYGALTITKSITIMGVEGASAGRNAADNGITINAGPDDTVSLSYLTVDGFKTARNGILLNSGGSLRITNCTVQNFTFTGILIQPSSGTTALLIADTAVTNNGASGISLFPKVTGVVKGAVERVLLDHNGSSGLEINRSAPPAFVDVTVADSMATHNSIGYLGNPAGILRLVRSVASGNGTGVFVSTTVESAGNNTIHGNDTNIMGSLTNIGTQ